MQNLRKHHRSFGSLLAILRKLGVPPGLGGQYDRLTRQVEDHRAVR